MKISLKHFALGALIAFFPTFSHVGANIDLPKKPKPAILAYKNNYLDSDIISLSLNPIPTLEPKTQQTESQKAFPINSGVPSATPTQSIPQTQTSSYTSNYQSVPEDIYSLIDRYSNHYHVNKDMMLIIAKCESGYRNNAVNGPYAGIFQFLSSTWISNRNAMEEDPNPQLRFNAEEAVKTAAFKMSRDGFSAWPACSQKAKIQLSYNN